MEKQLSFIYENNRYVTLFGADDFLKTALLPDSNVANVSTINKSGGLTAGFKKFAGMAVKDVPIITDATIQVNANFYIVSGKAVIDGEEYNVRITAVGNEFTPVNPIGSKAEEPEEPEVKEESVPDEEPAKEEPVEENETEEESAVEEPGITNEETDECIKEEKNEKEETAAEVVTADTNVADIVSLTPDFASRHFNNSVGFSMGKPRKDGITELASGMQIGTASDNGTSGLLYGLSNMHRPNVAIIGNNRSPFARRNTRENLFPQAQAKREEIAKPAVTEAEVTPVLELSGSERDAALVKEWNKDAIHDPLIPVIPTIDEEESVEKKTEPATEQVDNKVLKETLRAGFSDEINAVIGDIPHALLGSISEFTMNDVSVERLQEQGSIYCIDGRWHKSGNWFCIDVVNKNARFFYNSKSNTYVEIPIKACRDWLQAVS